LDDPVRSRYSDTSRSAHGDHLPHGHHLDQIAQAELVAKVPVHTQNNVPRVTRTDTEGAITSHFSTMNRKDLSRLSISVSFKFGSAVGSTDVPFSSSQVVPKEFGPFAQSVNDYRDNVSMGTRV
jgi:hypothetical protein